MPTIEENLNAWSQYNWPDGGDEWSQAWGGTDYLWYGTIFPRLQYFLPTSYILEIAPGFGRMTNYLRKYCEKLIVVDLTEKCINACKERFATDTHIHYHVNDGKSLSMIPDKSIDFIFSWDSLVHAEADAIEGYINEFPRILKPNGFGFIHHSNIGSYVLNDKLSVENPHWRGLSVSAELFNNLCIKSGMSCISQEIVNWGGAILNDCFSVFTNKNSINSSTNIRENTNFMDEATRLKEISAQYSHNKNL